jgi:hypothetical protein
MGFTVYLPGGTKDSEFEAYARLLRQQGKDLGKLPRVPEEGTDNRWLYVWADRSEAEAFARELKKRTGIKDWVVTEVKARPSEGPFGPILIQLTRRSDGLAFALHPLSRSMIETAFPHSGPATGRPRVSSLFTGIDKWQDFQTTRGGLPALLDEVVPILTGLSASQLAEVGYSVIDTESGQTIYAVPRATSATA